MRVARLASIPAAVCCHREHLSSGSVLVELGVWTILSVSFTAPTPMMSPFLSNRMSSTR